MIKTGKYKTIIIKTLKSIKYKYLKITSSRLKGWTVSYSKKMDLTLLLNLDSYIDYHVYAFGSYDFKTLDLLDRIILHFKRKNNNSNRFIDIGSNIGLMSLYLNKKHNDLLIDAFEPCSNIFYQNQMNRLMNNMDYQLHQLLLGNHEKEYVKLFMNDNPIDSEYNKFNHGMNSIFLLDKYRSGEKYEICQIRRFDDFAKDNFNNNYTAENNFLIKIDVEGAELEVLQGMTKLITEVDNIVLLVELLFEQNHEKSCEVVKMMNDFGYAIFDIKGLPVDTNNMSKKSDGNYLFIKLTSEIYNTSRISFP